MGQLPAVVSVPAFSSSSTSVRTVAYRGNMSSSVNQEQFIQNTDDKTVLPDAHTGNTVSTNQLVTSSTAPMLSISSSCGAQSAEALMSVRQNDGNGTVQPLPMPPLSSTISVDGFPPNKVTQLSYLASKTSVVCCLY